MAYYEHLPIYRKAMETAVYFEKIVRNFSRYNKYTIEERVTIYEPVDSGINH